MAAHRQATADRVVASNQHLLALRALLGWRRATDAAARAMGTAEDGAIALAPAAAAVAMNALVADLPY